MYGVRRTASLAVAVAVLVSAGIMGCNSTTAPEGTTTIEKPEARSAGRSATTQDQPGRTESNSANRGRPISATFKQAEPVWIVSHFAEQTCNGLVAGAEVRSKGNVSHLGLTTATASAAWDWSSGAAGAFSPVGPTTGPSATVIDAYPHAFCSAPLTATGEVVMVAANGDELHGIVTGGEVYELGYDVAGDGQEQFVMVSVDGGTGRFSDATGEFVLHLMARFDLSGFHVLRSEILPGGWVQY